MFFDSLDNVLGRLLTAFDQVSISGVGGGRMKKLQENSQTYFSIAKVPLTATINIKYLLNNIHSNTHVEKNLSFSK